MSRFWYLLRLAGQSAWNRRNTLILVIFSITLSTTLLLGLSLIHISPAATQCAKAWR